MKILDMSAGYRHIWYKKDLPFVTFLDRRPEVNPTFVCDTCRIPEEVGKDFDLVVFDPPHGTLTATSDMSRIYGTCDAADLTRTLAGSSREAWRISKPNALMAFKWNTCQRKLESVLPLLHGWEPLFCHGLNLPGRKKSQTYWVMLKRSNFPPPPGMD